MTFVAPVNLREGDKCIALLRRAIQPGSVDTPYRPHIINDNNHNIARKVRTMGRPRTTKIVSPLEGGVFFGGRGSLMRAPFSRSSMKSFSSRHGLMSGNGRETSTQTGRRFDGADVVILSINLSNGENASGRVRHA